MVAKAVAHQLDAYGASRLWAADQGAKGGKLKFVGGLGHPSESETGLIYMRARYMDPEVGRFISEDPAGDGANWFVYCNDDPVNLFDPDGQVIYGVIGFTIFLIGTLIMQAAMSQKDNQDLAVFCAISGRLIQIAGVAAMVMDWTNAIGPMIEEYRDHIQQGYDRINQAKTEVTWSDKMLAAQVETILWVADTER